MVLKNDLDERTRLHVLSQERVDNDATNHCAGPRLEQCGAAPAALHSRRPRPPWTRAPPQRRRAAATPADGNVTSTTSDAATAAAPTAAEAANGHQRKTAAVFGFFGASDRELALIEKRYAKNGYECVVVPSPVKEVARPSGWYKISGGTRGWARTMNSGGILMSCTA